jgi:hypothetical protein
MQPIQNIIQLYSELSTLWNFLILLFIVIVGGGISFIAYMRVFISVWWRLGKGLTKRQIAIFAKGDHFLQLKELLINSKLFKEKNIIQIHEDNIKKAKDITIKLVYWEDYELELNNILNLKKESDALIVYALPKTVKCPQMEQINKEPNCILVNLRGRLINDILVSMITTGYNT